MLDILFLSFLRLWQYLALSSYSIYPLMSDPLMNWKWKPSFSLPHVNQHCIPCKGTESSLKNHLFGESTLETCFIFLPSSTQSCRDSESSDPYVPVAEHQKVQQMSTKTVSNSHTQAKTSSYLPRCQTRVEHEPRKGTLYYRLTLSGPHCNTGEATESQSSVSQHGSLG